MTKFKLIAALAIVLPAIASPVLAQAVIQEPGAYAKNVPDGDLGIRSLRSSRGTNVWPAPVGHRQPRQADIPSSAAGKRVSLIFEQEDALVDRKISGVCRGC